MIKKNKTLSNIVLILRLITGLVFIFSSFVKGVDPIGTAYRVEDYLEAYGLYFLLDYTFALAVFLILTEFILGISMLFKLSFRLGTLGVFLIMIFFTIVTYFDAKLNLVPDCGCFGDAIKLTNWETFYKNILLIIMAFFLFVWRKHSVSRIPLITQFIVLLLFGVIFTSFTFYNNNHLPLIDFRNWKVGKDMKTIGEENSKVYLTYKNKETGEMKEYLSPNYPWNDSVWLSQWEFLGQRFDNSGLIKQYELIIEDSLANDYTRDLIESPDYQILIVSPDLAQSDKVGLEKAINISAESGLPYAIITGSDFYTAGKIISPFSVDELYFSDDISLKAMIRSNPGIVIMKNGVVLKKLHFNDFPDKLNLDD